jgi:hypothetical protein
MRLAAALALGVWLRLDWLLACCASLTSVAIGWLGYVSAAMCRRRLHTHLTWPPLEGELRRLADCAGRSATSRGGGRKAPKTEVKRDETEVKRPKRRRTRVRARHPPLPPPPLRVVDGGREQGDLATQPGRQMAKFRDVGFDLPMEQIGNVGDSPVTPRCQTFPFVRVAFSDFVSLRVRQNGWKLAGNAGDPGRIRTGDHSLRRRVLYPAELRGHCVRFAPATRTARVSRERGHSGNYPRNSLASRCSAAAG